VIAQGIADIVEADGMTELGEEQTHDVTPRSERARLFVDAVLAGKSGDQVGRNELAELSQDRQLRFDWFVFHPADPAWDRPPVTSKMISVLGRL
jgi:hypothetical protein